MEKKEILLITAVVLTIFVSIGVFFFDFYKYHFEFKKDMRENTYIALRNGRYYELLCDNDVIDNGVDFTLKPFNDFNIQNRGNRFKRNIVCNEEDGSVEKKISLERTSRSIKVRQNISSNLENIGENSFYYTHIEYPLISEVKETDKYIQLYDLNCTTKIYKKDTYIYKVIDNFVRVGTKYDENINFNFDIKIECL